MKSVPNFRVSVLGFTPIPSPDSRIDGDLLRLWRARADFKAFDKIMKRKVGKAPSKGDEMPV